MAFLLVLANSLTPNRSQCDILELNHFSPCNCHRFDQYILWKQYPNGVHVAAYRMKAEGQILRRLSDGTAVLTYWIGHHQYDIRGVFKETWTEQDPERLDREFVSEAERIGL